MIPPRDDRAARRAFDVDRTTVIAGLLIAIVVVALNVALIISLSRTAPDDARVCPDAGPCSPAAAVNPTSPSAEKSR